MKHSIRFFVAVFFLLLLVLPATARTYVLSVGVAEYKDPEVPDLVYSGKDAIKFASVMKTQAKDVVTLTSGNATHDNILSVINTIAAQAVASDRFVMFFSGHGANSLILTHDKPLYYSELNSALAALKSKEIVLFIDACHSGSIADDIALPGKDVVVMASSRKSEYSREERNFVLTSYMTQALLKGMQGKADFDKNKQITVIELFKYIYQDVTSRADDVDRLSGNTDKQHPQLITSKRCHSMVVTTW